jgi:hypothetical protein
LIGCLGDRYIWIQPVNQPASLPISQPANQPSGFCDIAKIFITKKVIILITEQFAIAYLIKTICYLRVAMVYFNVLLK